MLASQHITNPGLVWAKTGVAESFRYFHEFQEVKAGKDKGRIKVRVRTRWYTVRKEKIKRWPS